MNAFSKALLYIIVITIPFNGVAGPKIFGELSLEASAPLIGILIILNIGDRVRKGAKNTILYLLIFSILTNIVANIGDIDSRVLGETTGWDKYISSLMVLLFYTVFGMVIYDFSIKTDIFKCIEKAVVKLSIALSILFLLEFSSWYADGLRETLRIFRSYVSVNSWYEVGRIYGVSFEPSFNAAILIGLWPLLILYGSRTRTKGYRIMVMALVIVFLFTAFFSDSRAAVLVVTVQALLFLCFRYSGVSPKLMAGSWLPITVSIIMPVGVWYYIAYDVGNIAIADSSVSNITRINAVNALISIWNKNIYFGAGFGQFGFLYRSYSSPLSASSWEVINYFYGSKWNEISPSFSLHWRILAEGGVTGFLCFFTPFAILFSNSARKIVSQKYETDRDALITVQVGLAGELLFGASFDSFRNPLLWMYAGIAASYLRRDIRDTRNYIEK